MKALKEQGIEETCMVLMEDKYKVCTGSIILQEKSEKFSIRKGVRQELE